MRDLNIASDGQHSSWTMHRGLVTVKWHIYHTKHTKIPFWCTISCKNQFGRQSFLKPSMKQREFVSKYAIPNKQSQTVKYLFINHTIHRKALLTSESNEVSLLIIMLRFWDSMSLNMSEVDCFWSCPSSCIETRLFTIPESVISELLRDQSLRWPSGLCGECKFSWLPNGLGAWKYFVPVKCSKLQQIPNVPDSTATTWMHARFLRLSLYSSNACEQFP